MTTADPLGRVLSRLENVKSKGNGGYMARCPAHDDRRNSLSIDVGDDGRVLLHCFASCSVDAIAKSLDLTMADLHPARRQATSPNGHARHLVRTIRYEICDVDGTFKAMHVRKEYNDGSKDMPWERPDGASGLGGVRVAELPLYGVHQLGDADTVIVCEGEKARDALVSRGVTAVGTVTGAKEIPSDESLRPLVGTQIGLWADNDTLGRKHMDRIAKRLSVLGQPTEKIRRIEWAEAPVKGDAADWVFAGGTPEELGRLIADAPLWISNSSNSEEIEDCESNFTVWSSPIPLPEGERPEFPTSLLPKPLASYVSALAVATQTPPALAAFTVLGAVAIAAAKQFTVLVRPGWVEPVNVYTLVSLGSGNRKSAVVDVVGRPLREFEAKQAEAMAVESAQARARRDMEEKRLDHFKKVYAKEDNGDKGLGLWSDIRDLAERLETDPQLQVPLAPRLLVDDITPERLAALMADNNGRMGVLSAEGGIFQIIAGRYKDKGAESLDLFLKGHSGDDMPIDRVGRPTKHLHAPALTMALAVQPDVLAGLSAHQGFRGLGLLARFAYAVPVSMVGRRRIAPPPVPLAIEQAYADLINAILRLSECEEPLTLSPAASVALIAFERDLEPRLGPDGDLEHLADWGSKLAGLVARLAGLLHVITSVMDAVDPRSHEISAKTIHAVITIAESFLIPHAKTAFAFMGADPAIERSRRLLREIVTWPEGTISRRDLHQKLRVTFPKPEDLDRPLALLEEHGHIRRVVQETTGPGRKPSPRYEINPLGRGQNPHNAHKARVQDHYEDSEDSEDGAGSHTGHAATDAGDPWAEAEIVRL